MYRVHAQTRRRHVGAGLFDPEPLSGYRRCSSCVSVGSAWYSKQFLRVLFGGLSVRHPIDWYVIRVIHVRHEQKVYKTKGVLNDRFSITFEIAKGV